MIIRICHKEVSERLNYNNTVKKVQWTFDSEAENLTKRSAVTDNQHLTCVSEWRKTCGLSLVTQCATKNENDLAYVIIADNHNT